MTPRRSSPLSPLAQMLVDNQLTSHTQSSEDITWHSFHSDPIQDVVIKSKDEIYFRASSHSLKRESTLFNGMLSTIPNKHMSAADAIPLDYSSTVIALFLDRYAIPTMLDYDTVDFPILHEHFGFIHYLDCARLSDHVHKAYNKVCQAKPYSLLLACSQDNSLTNVTIALNRCAAIKQKLDTSNIYDIVSVVRSTWRLPLLKCLLDDGMGGHDNQYYHHYGSGSSFSVSWPNAERAENFVKDVREAEGELRTI